MIVLQKNTTYVSISFTSLRSVWNFPIQVTVSWNLRISILYACKSVPYPEGFWYWFTSLGAQTRNQKKNISEIKKVLKHKTIVSFVLKINSQLTRGTCVQFLASIFYFLFFTFVAYHIANRQMFSSCVWGSQV